MPVNDRNDKCLQEFSNTVLPVAGSKVVLKKRDPTAERSLRRETRIAGVIYMLEKRVI